MKGGKERTARPNEIALHIRRWAVDVVERESTGDGGRARGAPEGRQPLVDRVGEPAHARDESVGG